MNLSPCFFVRFNRTNRLRYCLDRTDSQIVTETVPCLWERKTGTIARWQTLKFIPKHKQQKKLSLYTLSMIRINNYLLFFFLLSNTLLNLIRAYSNILFDIFIRFFQINYLNYPYKLFHGQWYFPHWFVLICNPIAICLRTKPYQSIHKKKENPFQVFFRVNIYASPICVNCKMCMLVLVFSDFVLYYINMNLILLLLSYISEPTEWKSNNKNKSTKPPSTWLYWNAPWDGGGWFYIFAQDSLSFSIHLHVSYFYNTLHCLN